MMPWICLGYHCDIKIYGLFLKIFYFIYFWTEGKGRRKRGREISVYGCLHTPPTGDLAHNPGMCPDWGSNQWPFGSQAGALFTETHQHMESFVCPLITASSQRRLYCPGRPCKLLSDFDSVCPYWARVGRWRTRRLLPTELGGSWSVWEYED